MLRSIGSVTFLALFMVGCGGGGGASSLPLLRPPPPPPTAPPPTAPPPTGTYTVGGTVSGLQGTGLTLAICIPVSVNHGYGCSTRGELQISANGAFTLDSSLPASWSYAVYVTIARQPSSPTQRCLFSNATDRKSVV